MTKHPSTKHQSSDIEYWKDRAAKARRMARSHDQQYITDHFLKIAIGYDHLAEQAETAVKAGAVEGNLRPRKRGPQRKEA